MVEMSLNMSWMSILTQTALSLLILLLSISIYRLFLSPLARARIPGPFLYSISRLPLAYHLATGNLPFKIAELHDRYGPVVRLAPEEVSFITDAWNDIYAKQPNRTQLRKDPFDVKGPEGRPGGLLFEHDDIAHAHQRRHFSHAFSEKSLREQEPIIQSYIELLIEKLHENVGKNNNIANWYKFTTFDVIGDLVFGESFDCLKSATLHTWIHYLFAWASGAAVIGMTERFWPFAALLLFFVPKHMKDAEQSHRVMTAIRLDKRLANKEPRPDFISHVQKFLNAPNGLSYDEILETCRVLVTAGSETTGTLLTGLTYYLLANPSVYEKLTKEIRGAFKEGNEINMQSVQKLDYLLAVINEALRLFPPVPGNLRRMTPQEGWWITGLWVPGNVVVAVDIYAANISSTNFTRPKEFIPERWLSDPPAEFMQDKLKIVQPFSYGPRNCLGKNLAYMEMRLILAKVLFEFDLQLQEESNDWLSRVKALGFWEMPELVVKVVSVKKGE